MAGTPSARLQSQPQGQVSSDSSTTKRLLDRAHSPNTAQRIFSDKIEYRKLLLRPSSPPPSDVREARRKTREVRRQRERKKTLKPAPLSARERRRLEIYNLPQESKKYSFFEPLHSMWLSYIREIMGDDVYSGGQAAAAKLTTAEFVGAKLVISRSSCPSRVGLTGIIIKDTRFTFEIITAKNTTKTIPKEGTIFKFEIAILSKTEAFDAKDGKETWKGKESTFVFEIHGDQFQHRPADRSNKKFKTHFSKTL